SNGIGSVAVTQVHHAARRRSCRVGGGGARAARRAGAAYRRKPIRKPLRAMAFWQALAKLGWSEGRNVGIDFRFGAGGDLDRMRAQAKELTGLTPDVIVAESTPAAVALHQETAAVPIVFLQVANPIGSGLVASLARPGANLIGFTNFEPTNGRQVAR